MRLEEPWLGYARAVIEIDVDEQRWVIEPSPTEDGFRERASRPAAPRSPTEPDALSLLPLPRPIAIVTAWNPHPMFHSRDENDRRGRALCAALEDIGVDHHPAIGRSPDWSAFEHSRAVVGADRSVVLEVAARFDQLAIFEITERIACVDMDGIIRSSCSYTLTHSTTCERWP